MFGFDVVELINTLSDTYYGYPRDFLNYGADDLSDVFKSDKLFGFPEWPLGDVCVFRILRNASDVVAIFFNEYAFHPPCKICRKRMKLLFQLDGRKIGIRESYIFRDRFEGIGHITVCPEHSDVLGFYLGINRNTLR